MIGTGRNHRGHAESYFQGVSFHSRKHGGRVGLTPNAENLFSDESRSNPMPSRRGRRGTPPMSQPLESMFEYTSGGSRRGLSMRDDQMGFDDVDMGSTFASRPFVNDVPMRPVRDSPRASAHVMSPQPATSLSDTIANWRHVVRSNGIFDISDPKSGALKCALVSVVVVTNGSTCRRGGESNDCVVTLVGWIHCLYPSSKRF